MDKWKTFEDVNFRWVKSYPNDRKDYSRSEARANNYIRTVGRNSSGEIAVIGTYSPSKKWDKSKLVNTVVGPDIAKDIRYTPIKTVSKHKPYKPNSWHVENCYMDVSANSNGKFLGKAPLRSGIRPTKVYFPRREVFAVVNDENTHKNFKTWASNCYTVGAGTMGARRQLVNFSKGTLVIPKAYTKTKRLISKYFERNKGIGFLNFKPYKAQIFTMPFRGESISGGDSGNYFSSKYSGWKSLCTAASQLWDKVHAEPTISNSTYTLAAREKAVIHKDIGKEVNSRNVVMQDAVNFFLAKPYAYVIEKYLFNDKFNNVNIGKSTTHYGFEDLLWRNKMYPWGLEFDWSLYDSSIIREKLIGAFAIARGFFPEGDDVDNFFIHECHHLVDKFIVANDGNLFKLSKGLPSGSVWTTIINSFANVLLMEEIGAYYPGFRNKKGFEYQVAGDDGQIFFLEKLDKFSKRRFESWCSRRFNMDLEVANFGSPISKDINKSLTFNKLCYYYDGGVIKVGIQDELLKKRMLCIQTNVSKRISFIDNIRGQFDQLITTESGIDFISRLYATAKTLDRGMVGFAREYDDAKVIMTESVQNTYFTPGNPSFIEKKIEDRGKVSSTSTENFKFGEVDKTFVENWLFDNSKPGMFPRPGDPSRYQWFKSMVGFRAACEVFKSLGDQGIDQLTTAGVGRAEIESVVLSIRKYDTS